MNSIKTAILAILIGMSGAANAAELLAPNHYANELDRCVAQIRADLGAGPETRLQHQVTDIRKDGAWYKFVIETRGSNSPVTSTCQANRFNPDTRLNIERASGGTTQLASSI